MEPEWRKNRVKIEKNAVWHLKCSQVGSRRGRGQCADHQIVDFGVPLGTPNRPKIDLWTPKCGRACFLTVFYSMLCLAQFSDSIWGRIFMKNRCFFQCDFPEILFFFQPGDPHQTLYFTSRNLLFHFFIFSFFHRTND